MQVRRRLSALIIVGLLLGALQARALDFDFIKIADTNTTVPGTGSTFGLFQSPVLDSYSVAFRGNAAASGGGSQGKDALYISNGGALTQIASSSTAVPAGSGTFFAYGDPSLNHGNIAFAGYSVGASPNGIYSNIGGLNRLADVNTPIPSGTGNFTSFGTATSLDGGNILFYGLGSGGQQGMYSSEGGLHAVADTSTPIPSGSGNFISILNGATMQAGNVAFSGSGSAGQSGIYTNVGGTLHTVADKNTTPADSAGPFSTFGTPALSNGNVGFYATTASQAGVYTDIGGINAVADLATAVPGGTGNFVSFGATPALSNGVLTFSGIGGGLSGIFTNYGGALSAVVTNAMFLDGKKINGFPVGISKQGSSNGDVAFMTTFSDGSQGIYVAEQSYDYAANTSGAWDTASNWSFGLKPRTVVYTNIHPDNGLVVTGPASATTVRGLDLGANNSGVAELRLQATGQLTVNEYLYVETLGKLSVNGGVATATYGTYNYGTVDLGSGGQINGSFLSNSGTLQGSGIVGEYVYNYGTVQTSNSQQMQFTGGISNYGHIQAINAQMQFSGQVSNTVILDQNNLPVQTGQIDVRNAQLEFNGGLSNQGHLNFTFGTSDVFGAINNVAADPIGHTPGGQIIISGNSNVTFYDAVVQNGDVFRISTGSTAIFFGPVSGAGAFTGGGAKIFEGGYSPGNSPATVSLDGPVTLGDTNTLKIELGGTTPGTQYDQVHVVGQFALGGALQISLINPGTFTPAAHEKFDILDWGTLNGTFASLSLPALASPLAWNTSQLYTTGVLSIIDSNYLPGDINRDGKVTVADISALMVALSDLNTYQSSHPGMSDPQNLLEVADLNQDGLVTNADIQALISLVANNIASGIGGNVPAGGEVTAVPEPASIVLLGIGALAIAFCRRLRKTPVE